VRGREGNKGKKDGEGLGTYDDDDGLVAGESSVEEVSRLLQSVRALFIRRSEVSTRSEGEEKAKEKRAKSRDMGGGGIRGGREWKRAHVSDNNRVVSTVLRAKRLVRNLAQLKSDRIRQAVGGRVSLLCKEKTKRGRTSRSQRC
jgi:hypothetical protein